MGIRGFEENNLGSEHRLVGFFPPAFDAILLHNLALRIHVRNPALP
jgi:hypothetical protein